MADSPVGGLGTAQTKQFVLVTSEVPVTIEDPKKLVEGFAGILGMGLVQRVEFRSDKTTATVERLTPVDEIKDGESVLEPLQGLGPKAEHLDLYALIRSGDVPLDEVDASECESVREAVVEGRRSISGRNLRVAYILAPSSSHIDLWFDSSEAAEADTLLGCPLEYDTNIPGDALILFGGLFEGCDRGHLTVAVRVVLPAVRSKHEGDGADDQAWVGAGEGGDGAGEEWEDPAGDGPPSLFGPAPE